jgi:hypothetical protein
VSKTGFFHRSSIVSVCPILINDYIWPQPTDSGETSWSTIK